jgi:hypothetical protein
MILICFVMWDDIVLNRWLLQNARNTGGVLLSKGMYHNKGEDHKGDFASGKPRRGLRGACL